MSCLLSHIVSKAFLIGPSSFVGGEGGGHAKQFSTAFDPKKYISGDMTYSYIYAIHTYAQNQINNMPDSHNLYIRLELKKTMFRPPGDDSQAARMPRIKRVCHNMLLFPRIICLKFLSFTIMMSSWARTIPFSRIVVNNQNFD